MQAAFNHLQIPVSDLARSVEFYCRVLGGRELLRDGDEWALVRCGTYDLALARSSERISAERFHFGFGLASKAETEAWFERLTAQPVKVVRPWSDHGDWADFIIADPDGYPVQLYWEEHR